jgi:hypothetical protein
VISLNLVLAGLRLFLPTQAILLKYCLQKTVKKWHFAEVDYSSAKNDFGGFNPSKNMGCLLKKIKD